ncbi:EamA family transporter RarD [Luteipulveratus mongoliensis]|uniref:Membrane protein n=1 Tax=Luteipulveratus mongoliensis TaxID=571913 RepID=A0A0K1JMW2_9MICO|nr:EamA family transporter RarD [Luteipulveratus mongoliensis]AKU17915.1 membrane protein [Luteipulveratus mongoliensis]
MTVSGTSETNRGAAYGFLAYFLWGAMPLYFDALKPAGAWEILTHRVLWTVLLCGAGLAVWRRLGYLRELIARPRRLATVALASVLIATNWTIYVAAVVSGHATEAALGYFLNPLVTVALGVLVLRERLRPLQWVAVAVGALACVYLAIDYGQPPWISIGLALSFATYGLLKNRLGGSMTAVESLTAETLVLAPAAAVLLVVLTVRGDTTFTTEGAWHTALLVLAGVVTAGPLLLFAAAARRVPLVTIGLLQFVAPVLQLLCAVLLLDEQMPASRWIGFGIVWIALVLLTIDTLRSATRSRRARALTAAAAAVDAAPCA